MTEIENILNGIPYNFLVENPDKQYEDIKLIRILQEKVYDGIVHKEAILMHKERDQFLRCVWALDFVHNKVLFEEINKIDAKDVVLLILKSLNINDTITTIERHKEDS
jgi:hypothetical protein